MVSSRKRCRSSALVFWSKKPAFRVGWGRVGCWFDCRDPNPMHCSAPLPLPLPAQPAHPARCCPCPPPQPSRMCTPPAPSPPLMDRSARAALSADTPTTRSSTVPAVTRRSTSTCDGRPGRSVALAGGAYSIKRCTCCSGGQRTACSAVQPLGSRGPPTSLVCPRRCARAWACLSSWGFQSGERGREGRGTIWWEGCSAAGGKRHALDAS